MRIKYIRRAVRRHWRRLTRRTQMQRDRIAFLEDGPRNPAEMRAAMKKYPGGFVFSPEDPRMFGDNPEEMARRVKDAEAGNFIPASDFFNGIRAKIHARR
jgi:hypothetical protein